MSDSDLPIIAGVIPEQLGVHVTPLGLEFSPNITQENYAKLMGCLLDIADFSVHYNPMFKQEANEILLSPESHLISLAQLRQWCEQLARHVLHGQITQAAALASTILQRFKEEAQYRRTIEAKAAPKYTPRR